MSPQPPTFCSFWQAFSAQVEAQPEALALQSSNGSLRWTYRELRQIVCRCATGLRQRGLRPGQVVILAYPRSPDFVISLLATWAAGLVWCPLSDQPPERRQELEQRLQAPLILGPGHGDTPANETPWQSLLPPADGPSPKPLSIPVEPQPTDPAYLIFTSGSSGRPKGVLVPHAGLVTVFQAQIKALDLRVGERCLWLLSPLFDASLSDLGTALLAGATLIIDPEPLRSLEYFYHLLERWQIHYLDLPPSLLPNLDPQRMPLSLNKMLIGGEAPPAEAVRSWSRRLRLLNVYGPTEASICTSLCRCGPDWQAPLLGQPLPGVLYRLSGPSGEALPDGEAGELWIHSPGLALGYWRDPEQSQKRFVFRDSLRWFRSGDQVVREGSAYRFLGRLDRQIKQLGRLICPEEIEAALRREYPQGQVAVVQHQQGPLLACLAGPFAPERQSQLQLSLKQTLPGWMQPDLWLWLDPKHHPWPQTANGKTDLQALAQWSLHNFSDPQAVQNFVPQTPHEVLLARIWRRVLGQERWPAGADFFALGGNSLKVLSAVALAAEAGWALSPEWFYRARSLEALAELSQDPLHATSLSRQELLRSLPPNQTQTQPKLPAQPALALEAHSNHRLLLTGATGFLGSRLLAEILHHTRWQVTCLLRPTDPARIESRALHLRLEQALKHWNCPSDRARIQIVPADLAQPELGLSAQQWQALRLETDAILHVAAQVDLVRDYASLKAVNVDSLSPLQALQKPFHYVSTLSVWVAAEPRPATIREMPLHQPPFPERLYGGYAQSKWAAEAWLSRQSTALPHWIYRPGLITGDSQTGQGPERDWLQGFLQGLLLLGALPQLAHLPASTQALAVDITPVDYAAQGILKLMQAPAGIYHLANPQALSLQTLLDTLAQWSGLPQVPWLQWQARLSQALQSEPDFAYSASLLALSALLQNGQPHQPWHALNLFQATGFQLASATTTAQLEAQGLHCPQANTSLLQRYFTHCAAAVDFQSPLSQESRPHV